MDSTSATFYLNGSKILVQIFIPPSVVDQARQEGSKGNRSTFILYNDDSLFQTQAFASPVRAE